MTYKDVVKNLKAKDWETADDYTNVIVLVKGTKRILVDKSQRFHTIGYMIEDIRSKDLVSHGEISDIMEVFNLDKQYGK